MTSLMDTISLYVMGFLVAALFALFFVVILVFSRTCKIENANKKQASIAALLFFVATIVSWAIAAFADLSAWIFSFFLLISGFFALKLVYKNISLMKHVLGSLTLVVVFWIVIGISMSFLFPAIHMSLLKQSAENIHVGLEQNIKNGIITNCSYISTDQYGFRGKELCYNKMAEINDNGYHCLFLANDYDNPLYNISQCLGRVGNTIDDFSCGDITNGEKRNICNFNLARVRLDNTSCQNIVGEAIFPGDNYFVNITQETCQKNIQLVQGRYMGDSSGESKYFNESDCDTITGDSQFRDKCYGYFVNFGVGVNASICDKMVDDDRRYLCLQNFE